MQKLISLFRLSFLPQSSDFGLLLLRLGLGGGMFWLHGKGKWTGFAELSKKFPDPLHIGAQYSLGLAVFGEVICALMLMFGLGARFAALSLFITMAVAFFMVSQGAISGPKGNELAAVYMVGYLALVFSGPGKYSIDRTPS